MGGGVKVPRAGKRWVFGRGDESGCRVAGWEREDGVWSAPGEGKGGSASDMPRQILFVCMADSKFMVYVTSMHRGSTDLSLLSLDELSVSYRVAVAARQFPPRMKSMKEKRCVARSS